MALIGTLAYGSNVLPWIQAIIKGNPMYMDSYTDITQYYAHDRTITKLTLKFVVLYNVVYV